MLPATRGGGLPLACPDCGAEQRSGARFCSRCGTSLDAACAGCGAPYEPGDVFCAQCGARVAEGAGAAGPDVGTSPSESATKGVATPETEIRLVSVLFLDLVGFTTIAEGRDPERVRELLDRYFSRARRVVERYGGTVEKFIGDAVMAVWGTPITHDDDAERAVRAALELVADVETLGGQEGVDGLRARAGITSGRVAVTLGVDHQGMVAGDRVNTAARLQTAAAPGEVLVDEATRRATSTAIAYDSAGDQRMKGKDEVVAAFRARRVVARRGGSIGAQGLEPPFVGRDREFRLLREVYETVGEQGSAAMVSVVGQAGIGKSRLAWEFEKHLDGLVEPVYWHRGRCLAYGEGVAYAALAEMVRARADIADDEDPATARRKLENAVSDRIDDHEERAFVLSRLAQLLGLDDGSAPDQASLFAGWRLFFERMAERDPVVLVFEDLQWADRGLLDFLEHLLDWARDRPLFVLTLARPEIVDRVDWASHIRNLTSIHLERLSDDAMEELLVGLVPGLPDELRSRIADRAEGVPLYAVETVRVLLDRGQLLPGEQGYELASDVDELVVPETLQTLVAARLDGLEPNVRDLVQHAAVLGQSFTREGLVALTGLEEPAVDEGLRTLRARDIIGVDASARGHDSGRYTFLQALVRTVAYETLSRHERRRRHLSAARHLETSTVGDELAEIVATHFLDAYRADPDAEDAEEVRTDALRMLHRAADRAEAVAALSEAQRCCEVVIDLTDDPQARAEALLRAGVLAQRAGGETDRAVGHLRAALEAFEELGDTRGQALAEAGLGRIAFDDGRAPEAVERLEAALVRLDPAETPVEYARIASELARNLYFVGRVDDARRYVESALPPAEHAREVEVVCDALNTKALILWHHGQPEEAAALLNHAYSLSARTSSYTAFRAANNLCVLLSFMGQWDRNREVASAGLRRARREGDRNGQMTMLVKLANIDDMTGRWDEAIAHLDAAEEVGEGTRYSRNTLDQARLFLFIQRGDLEEARAIMERLEAGGPADEQERLFLHLGRMMYHNRTREHREAVQHALEVTDSPTTQSSVAARVHEAVASAIALGDLGTADELRRRSDRLAEPADVLARASLLMSDARISAARGAPDTQERYRTLLTALDAFELRADRIVAQIELAEWFLGVGRSEAARDLLEDAERSTEEMGAKIQRRQLDELRARHPELVPAPV